MVTVINVYAANCVIKCDATCRNSVHALTPTEAGVYIHVLAPVRARPCDFKLSLLGFVITIQLQQAQVADILHCELNKFKRSSKITNFLTFIYSQWLLWGAYKCVLSGRMSQNRWQLVRHLTVPQTAPGELTDS